MRARALRLRDRRASSNVGVVDVLSDAINAFRVGRLHASVGIRRAPWGAGHDRVAGAGFHVVLSGHAWLSADQRPPLRLGPGDVTFLARGLAHAMADDPVTAQRRAHQTLAQRRPFTEPRPAARDTVAWTGREASAAPETSVSTVLLCGGYLWDRGRSHPLLDALPEILHIPAEDRSPSLAGALDLLTAEVQAPRPGRSAAVSGLLDALLIELIRTWTDRPRDGRAGEDRQDGWAAALTDPGTAAALAAIHGDPARPWTLDALAREASMSRASFARRFHHLVGRPPMTYLTWWRMILAARSLLASDAPQAVIAREVGYSSEFAFAAAFKRCHGTAPGAYRRMRRDEIA